MTMPKILLQLDPDRHASVFDAVVAVDAGVDHLLQYAGVEPKAVRGLIHGAMFTRGPQNLQNTAVFIGGSDVASGERLLEEVLKCFFASLRVSVMLDANGANTTAAAAVLAAATCVPLSGSRATVLAGTGPVGQRAARLLAGQGASVQLASRSLERAKAVCEAIQKRDPAASIQAVCTSTTEETAAAIADAEIVIAAGAAGVELLSAEVRRSVKSLKVVIDLNAVPPAGIAGVEVMDKGKQRDGVLCFGAIGVGGTKMKIHRAALRKLFQANDQVLDAEEVFAIGRDLS